jgi:hypothetical protein
VFLQRVADEEARAARDREAAAAADASKSRRTSPVKKSTSTRSGIAAGAGAGAGAGAAAAATSTPGAGLRVCGLGLSKQLAALSTLLDPRRASGAGKVLAVVGGRDVVTKAAVVAHLLDVVDEVAVGGLLGVVWAHVLGGKGVGRTADVVGPDFGVAVSMVRRLIGVAARKCVRVHVPTDFVVGSKPFEAKEEPEEPEDDDDDDDEDEDVSSTLSHLDTHRVRTVGAIGCVRACVFVCVRVAVCVCVCVCVCVWLGV